MDDPWDCIVVGGGAAGLSAALTLGRVRLRTLVIDAGEPSNRTAQGIGGLLGYDGRPPEELYRVGRQELAGYASVDIRSGRVTGAIVNDFGFEVELDDGSRASARTLCSQWVPTIALRISRELPNVGGARCSTARSVTDGR